jgi:hypothetical protein
MHVHKTELKTPKQGKNYRSHGGRIGTVEPDRYSEHDMTVHGQEICGLFQCSAVNTKRFPIQTRAAPVTKLIAQLEYLKLECCLA